MKKGKKVALAKELLIDENKIKGSSEIDESVKCSECEYNDISLPNKPCPPGGSVVTEGVRAAKVFDCAGGRFYHYKGL